MALFVIEAYRGESWKCLGEINNDKPDFYILQNLSTAYLQNFRFDARAL